METVASGLIGTEYDAQIPPAARCAGSVFRLLLDVLQAVE
jgi:hypothetical protein